jgi:hypothetical protein
MNELSQYLRGSFHDQKGQVTSIYELVGKVLPVFINFWMDKEERWGRVADVVGI